MKTIYERMIDLNNQLLKVMTQKEFSLKMKVTSSKYWAGSKIIFTYEQGAEYMSYPDFDSLEEELLRTKLTNKNLTIS